LVQVDPEKDNPDILFCDLDWRAMVKRVISRPIEQWSLGDNPHRCFDGEVILEDLTNVAVRKDIAHIKTHNTLEPLTFRIDQRDRCFLNAEDVLAETHNTVEVLIGRGVENPKRVKLGNSLGVVL
jgi:hypothetical protein